MRSARVVQAASREAVGSLGRAIDAKYIKLRRATREARPHPGEDAVPGFETVDVGAAKLDVSIHRSSCKRHRRGFLA